MDLCIKTGIPSKYSVHGDTDCINNSQRRYVQTNRRLANLRWWVKEIEEYRSDWHEAHTEAEAGAQIDRYLDEGKVGKVRSMQGDLDWTVKYAQLLQTLGEIEMD